MPQLTGPEQKLLVELLIENLTEPGHFDRALIEADLGGLAVHSESAAFPLMVANVVRRFSSQYRILELVEAVFNSDYLKGECPPIAGWLKSNRDELQRRKNSPNAIRNILARANAVEPKHWIIAISSIVVMAAAFYFGAKLLRAPSRHGPIPTEAARSGEVAMPLTDEQLQRLREELGLAPEEVQNRSRFWPRGSTINVAFLDGSDLEREFVKSVASEWMTCVNLRLKYDDDADASEVRISFDQPGQAYSYLGTDCLGIDKDKATTQLGYIRETTDKRLRRFVVLHEFGHLLGFINEHQIPNADINWNWNRIAQVLGGSAMEARRNFDRISLDRAPREYIDKPFDPSSVLMYHPIPDDWLLAPLPSSPEDRLSAGDIEFAKRIYP